MVVRKEIKCKSLEPNIKIFSGPISKTSQGQNTITCSVCSGLPFLYAISFEKMYLEGHKKHQLMLDLKLKCLIFHPYKVCIWPHASSTKLIILLIISSSFSPLSVICFTKKCFAIGTPVFHYKSNKTEKKIQIIYIKQLRSVTNSS